MDWNENKHPRDDNGKFTSGSSKSIGEAKRVFDEAEKLGIDAKGIDNLDVIKAKIAEKKRLQSNSQRDIINLSKQEWAQYYKILGDEQHGDFVYRTPDGGRAVRLENKLVIDNGSFVNPKVSDVLTFADNDTLNDVINYIIKTGYIR